MMREMNIRVKNDDKALVTRNFAKYLKFKTCGANQWNLRR
jgi:hypothetical protein